MQGARRKYSKARQGSRAVHRTRMRDMMVATKSNAHDQATPVMICTRAQGERPNVGIESGTLGRHQGIVVLEQPQFLKDFGMAD